MKKRLLLDRISSWYAKSSLLRGIITSLPYGKGIHEFLLTEANKSTPNPVRCEMAASRLMKAMTDSKRAGFSTFELWGDEAELRRVLREFLQFYESRTYTVDLPEGIKHYHSDETGNEVLSQDTLRNLWCILSHRGYAWEDPYNNYKILTDSGKELLYYLKAD